MYPIQQQNTSSRITEMLITIVFPSGMSFLLEFLHESQEVSGIQLLFATYVTVFVKSCGYMQHNSYSYLSFTYF